MHLSKTILVSSLISFSSLPMGIMGLPRESPNRYVAGSASAVMQDLDTVDDGYLSVGADGVLRSFAKDATVIDYRQLDPDQVKSFAATQLAAWEASRMAMPSSVLSLADSSSASGVDGRLVTDLDQLLDPADKPAGVSAVKSREVLELLEKPEKRQNCDARLVSSPGARLMAFAFVFEKASTYGQGINGSIGER
ncbi:hypothetical protein FQN53_003872 [Emmonsiellopsis sp. PD_33]|nr:hypothetical protein FQN53_003872 [Emmonsiellopsis sp. PD_33]